jgi:hypothetical protein
MTMALCGAYQRLFRHAGDGCGFFYSEARHMEVTAIH